MKKTLFIAVLFLGMISLKAQEIHFGARMAGSFTKIKAVEVKSNDFTEYFVKEYNKNASNKMNLELGAFVEIMLNEQIAVAPEFNLAGAGVTFKDHEDGVDYSNTISLTYVQVPFMLKYYVNENININAGPQVGLLMSAKEKSFATNGEDNASSSENVKNDYKSTDFGFNLGAGYKMENGLFFDLRYYMGLSGILADNDNWADLKNTGIKFGVGYYFN